MSSRITCLCWVLNSFILLVHSWVLLLLLQQSPCPIKNVNAATSSTLSYIFLHSCFTASFLLFLWGILLSFLGFSLKFPSFSVVLLPNMGLRKFSSTFPVVLLPFLGIPRQILNLRLAKPLLPPVSML